MYSLAIYFMIVLAVSGTPLQQTLDKKKGFGDNSVQVREKDITTQHITTQISNKNDNKNDGASDSDKEEQHTAVASQIYEKPVYSPYGNVLPENLHQYLNEYATPYAAAPYFPIPGAYAVQTGYEGYLVPDVSSDESSTSYSTALTFVRSLVPHALVAWIIKGAVITLTTIGVILLGGLVTTAVCTLTPLCTISFAALSFPKFSTTAQAVGKALNSELTPERIQQTAELVQSAIEKFSQLQNVEETKTKIE